MDRRDALNGVVGGLAAAVSIGAMAQEHDHSKMHGASTAAGAGSFAKLAAAAQDCVGKGQACLAHCLVLLGEGDKSMAECAQNVNQMLALCGALQNLAYQQSNQTRALARIALDACQSCEKACRKHEKHHATCKACAESCAACAKECNAVLAS